MSIRFGGFPIDSAMSPTRRLHGGLTASRPSACACRDYVCFHTGEYLAMCTVWMPPRRLHDGLTASRPSACGSRHHAALPASLLHSSKTSRSDVAADAARGFQYGCLPAVYTAGSQHRGLRPVVVAVCHSRSRGRIFVGRRERLWDTRKPQWGKKQPAGRNGVSPPRKRREREELPRFSIVGSATSRRSIARRAEWCEPGA